MTVGGSGSNKSRGAVRHRGRWHCVASVYYAVDKRLLGIKLDQPTTAGDAQWVRVFKSIA